MKKLKTYSWINFGLGILFLLTYITLPVILFRITSAEHDSIGIIGGADNLTTLFLTYRFALEDVSFFLFLGLSLFVGGLFCLVFSKTVLANCTLKTTALSLGISLVGATGFYCFITWLTIIAFHNCIKLHPIRYPASIIIGLLSLVAFILLIVIYCKLRKRIFSVKGLVIDILTCILVLPFFLQLGYFIHGYLSHCLYSNYH